MPPLLPARTRVYIHNNAPSGRDTLHVVYIGKQNDLVLSEALWTRIGYIVNVSDDRNKPIDMITQTVGRRRSVVVVTSVVSVMSRLFQLAGAPARHVVYDPRATERLGKNTAPFEYNIF